MKPDHKGWFWFCGVPAGVVKTYSGRLEFKKWGEDRWRDVDSTFDQDWTNEIWDTYGFNAESHVIDENDKYADIQNMSEEDRDDIYQFAVQRSKEILNGEEIADKQEVNIYQSVIDETLESVLEYKNIKTHTYNQIEAFERMLIEWNLGIIVNFKLPSKKTISFTYDRDRWKLMCNASDWRGYPLSVMNEIIENFDKFLYAVQRAIGEEMGDIDEDH